MRAFIILLIGLAFAGAASAGFMGSTGPGIIARPHPIAQRYVLQGRVLAVRWTSYTGRAVSIPLPRPLDLDNLLLPVPAGEWVEVTLIFDGRPSLESEQGTVELPIPSLTAPLSWPASSVSGSVRLVVELPELDRSVGDSDATARAIEGGTVAHVEPFPDGAM